MAYVAVSGGQEAIEESIRLLHCMRGSTFKELEVEAIEKKLGLLVDRVMSESGLYAPAYAALALKQAEGSIEEAVFLLRAYRSTLSRNYYTLPASGTEMRAVRRISAAFKDIQGGQILGATYDYTHRLIEFKQPSAVELCARRQCCLKEAKPVPVVKLPRVSEYLKAEGLIDSCEIDDMEPVDVTKNVLEFPADRSARLQTLTRADGGFIGGLAYSSIRGYGAVHPTVGELRCGYVELEVPYLFDETESICIGEILLTEVEGFIPEDDDKKLKLAVGYGAVLGRNENKAISMAVAVPGYQVPFGSRELPIGRGWGTGGIQLTLSLIGPRDVLKVIDQGSDDSVNAVNIKKFINLCSDVATTTDSTEATLIQTRHRIPEEPLRNDQLLVFQVPLPEPLRVIEPSEEATKLMHAEADYTGIWMQLYESIMKYGKVTIATEYPVTVEDRYVMNPSPIPKYDNPRLHESECLYLFGAGREKKIYAIPPHTKVVSLAFDDVPFEIEHMEGRRCRLCGAENVYFDELIDRETGAVSYQCSDTGYCSKRRLRKEADC